jgi:hypothetical protein
MEFGNSWILRVCSNTIRLRFHIKADISWKHKYGTVQYSTVTAYDLDNWVSIPGAEISFSFYTSSKLTQCTCVFTEQTAIISLTAFSNWSLSWRRVVFSLK